MENYLRYKAAANKNAAELDDVASAWLADNDPQYRETSMEKVGVEWGKQVVKAKGVKNAPRWAELPEVVQKAFADKLAKDMGVITPEGAVAVSKQARLTVDNAAKSDAVSNPGVQKANDDMLEADGLVPGSPWCRVISAEHRHPERGSRRVPVGQTKWHGRPAHRQGGLRYRSCSHENLLPSCNAPRETGGK